MSTSTHKYNNAGDPVSYNRCPSGYQEFIGACHRDNKGHLFYRRCNSSWAEIAKDKLPANVILQARADQLNAEESRKREHKPARKFKNTNPPRRKWRGEPLNPIPEHRWDQGGKKKQRKKKQRKKKKKCKFVPGLSKKKTLARKKSRMNKLDKPCHFADVVAEAEKMSEDTRCANRCSNGCCECDPNHELYVRNFDERSSYWFHFVPGYNEWVMTN